MAPKKALIAITSNNDVFYEDGTKGGLYWSEAAHAYDIYKGAGFDVEFASETGKYGIDGHSLIPPQFISEDDLKVYEDKSLPIHADLAKIKKASDVNPDEFSIFFAAGGHATLFDFPTAIDLQNIARKIYNNGGVVSAVCHGPSIFAGLEDLVKGKKVTCFVATAEDDLGLGPTLQKFNLKTNEDLIKQIGGVLVPPPDAWSDFVVSDDRIVSGVNPASAHSTARESIKALA
jgi:putative intracellular protease/amidase